MHISTFLQTEQIKNRHVQTGDSDGHQRVAEMWYHTFCCVLFRLGASFEVRKRKSESESPAYWGDDSLQWVSGYVRHVHGLVDGGRYSSAATSPPWVLQHWINTLWHTRGTHWRELGHPVHRSLFHSGTGWKNRRGLGTTCTNSCTHRAWHPPRCAILPLGFSVGSICSSCTKTETRRFRPHTVGKPTYKSKCWN